MVTGDIPASLRPLVERAQREFIPAAQAVNTRRAYDSDWEDFEGWCRHHGVTALPADPATLVAYLVMLVDAGAGPSTLERRLASLGKAHRVAGYPSPTADEAVRLTWAGIQRTRRGEKRQAAPITLELLRQLIDRLPTGVVGSRDHALLLLGWAGALRRSEIAALDVNDARSHPEGVTLTIGRSKTDQTGEGAVLYLPAGDDPRTDPGSVLERWLHDGGLRTGALFRPIDRHGNMSERRLSNEGVNLIVQRAIERIPGIDPDLFSAHSLRAGFITTAADAGVDERRIMAHSRHRHLPTARGYIRSGAGWKSSPVGEVGL